MLVEPPVGGKGDAPVKSNPPGRVMSAPTVTPTMKIIVPIKRPMRLSAMLRMVLVWAALVFCPGWFSMLKF